MVLNPYIIRAYCAAVVGALAIFVPPMWFLQMVIVFGQGHFLLAYWYKFSNSSPWYTNQLFWLWTLLAVCLFTAERIFDFTFIFWLVSAALIFILHHVLDDVQFILKKNDWSIVFCCYAGFFLVFAIEIIEHVYATAWGILWLVSMSAVCLFLGLAVLQKDQQRTASQYRYFLCMSTFGSGLVLLTGYIGIIQILGSVVIFHYLLWYLEYYAKLQTAPTHLNIYLKRALLVNGVLITVFYVHSVTNSVPLYQYFYGEEYFYIWTVLHIIISFIPKNFAWARLGT